MIKYPDKKLIIIHCRNVDEISINEKIVSTNESTKEAVSYTHLSAIISNTIFFAITILPFLKEYGSKKAVIHFCVVAIHHNITNILAMACINK